jgi:murein DD-endopeptidase MepM/ murein hydrolase activator NlpD
MARRSKAARYLIRFVVLIVVAGLAFLGVAAFRSGPAPEIEIVPELPGIGKATPVRIDLREPSRGLGEVRVELIQGERVELLDERHHRQLEPWEFWGERVADERLTLEVGSATIEGLREGEATIRVIAYPAPSWLRRPQPAMATVDLEVKLRPPSLQITSTHTYVSQGGSEAVVYRVGESSIADGVRAGDWWFPGYPLPRGEPRDRFALFAAPYDLDDPGAIRLVVRDDVGNESTASFVDSFRAKPFKTDTIRLSEQFMAKVVPAIMSQTPSLPDRGDLLSNYLQINGDLRRRNSTTLIELAEDSLPRFLWSRPFMQMRNAEVRSSFADRRTYVYEGNEVDQQDHLGFDLASTRMAELQAANDGVVVLARYFGIYGNAVVIDHGYGLMSLYGHLSSIDVEEGQTVERGQPIGRTGETGLAGGDHLHFTMLLRGLPVNPREWWDGHWIQDRIGLKLGPALEFRR